MEEKARKFISLLGMDKVPDAIVESHVNNMREQFGGRDLPEAPAKALKLVKNAFNEKKSSLLDKFVDAYATTFTEDELDQLIFFHESHMGRRLAELGPVAQQKVMDANEQWSLDVMKSIQGELSSIFAPA